MIELVSELDEPEVGHADEAPRYVKNILARLRELPLHDREVWLKTIMGEFEQDFSRAKWREGYEQGKVEGLIEHEKVTVPQFVADYIESAKKQGDSLRNAMLERVIPKQAIKDWIRKREGGEYINQNTFALAWINGYTVEKEKRYFVKLKNIDDYLNTTETGFHFYNKWRNNETFTRKELEEANFGWVFDCPGIEIEEVEG